MLDIAILIISVGSLAVSIVVMAKVVSMELNLKNEIAAIENIVRSRLTGFLEVFRKANK